MADKSINGSIGLSAEPGLALLAEERSSQGFWWETGKGWGKHGKTVSEDYMKQLRDRRNERFGSATSAERPVFTGGEGYRVYVDDLLLPVPPDKLELSIQNRNKTMDLVSGGQINLLKTPGLSEVKFTALLPNQPYHFAMYEGGYRNAHAYLDKLEALKVNRKSFPLRVLRMGPGGDTVMESTSLTVSLEEYSILEDAERYGLDMAVDLTFKQFQPYGTKAYELTGDTAATEVKQREVTLTTGQETYTLQEGENLYTLSMKVYGHPGMQEALYELNKDVIEEAAKKDGLESSSKGEIVYAGTVLKLPPKAAEQAVATGQNPAQVSLANVKRLYTDNDVIVMAKLVYGEAGGIKSKVEKACVCWTICNRLDHGGYGATLNAVMTAKSQFQGYKAGNPVKDDIKALCIDVLDRWSLERAGQTNVGRVLPRDYLWFLGDLVAHNWFFNYYPKGVINKNRAWNYSLPSPY